MMWHMTPDFDIMAMGSVQEPRMSGYQIVDGIAVLEISGPTSKRGNRYTESTVRVRSLLRQAIADPAVQAILFVIDSPGGAVSGNMELANDVFEASKRKTTYAYASDMMASAAYEVGSQATRLYANASALIGSIGTMMALYDYSAYFDKNGIKAIPMNSGGMKGAGMTGTEITPDQQAYYQGIIDQMTAQFVNAVARGRNVHASQALSWADGRVHIAADAAKLGLIDGIMPLDQAVSELRTHTHT